MYNWDALRNWLMTFPKWDRSWVLNIDQTDATAGNYGLYPMGVEEMARREDVLGNVTVWCRQKFHLYRMTALTDRETNAKWLMELQSWVRQQSAIGAAPRFGDEPKEEKIRAEKGKLSERSQPGVGTYVVTLTADFVKKY